MKWFQDTSVPRKERIEDERGYDIEVVPLIDAMNEVPGIRTTESCSGHDQEPIRVWFKAESLDALPALLYWFDGCHSGFYGWEVDVATDCGKSPAHFKASGPAGAYGEADEIARLIREDVLPATYA